MGTAHWGEDGVWWRWSDGGVEATAFALRALLAIDPKNALVEPVTNWLVKNRRGAQWSNTRDTAIVVLALTDYLRTSGELSADLEYELASTASRIATAEGRPRRRALGARAATSWIRHYVRDGANEIRIARRSGGRGGSGRIYFAAERCSSASRSRSPRPAASSSSGGVSTSTSGVRRCSRATVYDGEPLADGGSVTSGERVEVVLTVEAKNDYEYLVFEDLKPAGLEAVEVRSGESVEAREIRASAHGRDPAAREPQDYTGRSRWVHQELRDRKVALFLDKLPQGVWEIRYELRAEVPGSFHALPALGHAMYVPEIRGNGDEARITVEDRLRLDGN